VSPRATARWSPAVDVAIKGSVGRYQRQPTVLELYGDRGFIVGTPDLLPETGFATDLGAVWAPAAARGAIDRIMIEAAGFASWPRDTIGLVVVGNVSKPINLDDAQLLGGEASASVRIARRVSVSANYTRLLTWQRTTETSYDGKPLPRQPGHALYGRVDAVAHALGRRAFAWSDVDWRSSSFLDRASLREVPGRAVVGVGAKLELPGRVLVGVEVKNLTDDRITDLPLANPPRPDLTSVPTATADVAGYPLPGRAFYLSLEWTP
jgi:vitamin B12 transporter